MVQTRAVAVQNHGHHRWRFLWQSLIGLERSLRALGQRLHIAWGDPETVIPALAHSHAISRIVRSRQPGTREAVQRQTLQDKLPKIAFTQYESLLPMPLQDLPATFSQFRKLIEKKGDRGPARLRIPTVKMLPPAPGLPDDNRGECPAIQEPTQPSAFSGGEQAGL